MNNTVTVGPADALDVTALTAIKPRWCGTAPSGPGSYTAQLRAHGGETEVTAELVDGTLEVTFASPVRGVRWRCLHLPYQGVHFRHERILNPAQPIVLDALGQFGDGVPALLRG